MVVISNTACMSALARIGELRILQQLFGEVIIPNAVLLELLELRTFGLDTSCFSKSDWLKTKEPHSSKLLAGLLSNQKIDIGEAFAIALAVELKANWLILDDLNARQIATGLQINITGLGGILIQAKKSELISHIKPLLDRCISEANFRLSLPVYDKILQLAGE